jgi:hypothetical protein
MRIIFSIYFIFHLILREKEEKEKKLMTIVSSLFIVLLALFLRCRLIDVTQTIFGTASNIEHESDDEIVNNTLPSACTPTDELVRPIIEQVLRRMTDECSSLIVNDLTLDSTDKDRLSIVDSTDETYEHLLSTISDAIEPIGAEISTLLASPTSYTDHSPVLSRLDDDPIVSSCDNIESLTSDLSNLLPQECIIIVECSDDEYDDDEQFIINQNDSMTLDLEHQLDESCALNKNSLCDSQHSLTTQSKTNIFVIVLTCVDCCLSMSSV